MPKRAVPDTPSRRNPIDTPAGGPLPNIPPVAERWHRPRRLTTTRKGSRVPQGSSHAQSRKTPARRPPSIRIRNRLESAAQPMAATDLNVANASPIAPHPSKRARHGAASGQSTSHAPQWPAEKSISPRSDQEAWDVVPEEDGSISYWRWNPAIRDHVLGREDDYIAYEAAQGRNASPLGLANRPPPGHVILRSRTTEETLPYFATSAIPRSSPQTQASATHTSRPPRSGTEGSPTTHACAAPLANPRCQDVEITGTSYGSIASPNLLASTTGSSLPVGSFAFEHQPRAPFVPDTSYAATKYLEDHLARINPQVFGSMGLYHRWPEDKANSSWRSLEKSHAAGSRGSGAFFAHFVAINRPSPQIGPKETENFWRMQPIMAAIHITRRHSPGRTEVTSSEEGKISGRKP